MLGLDADRSVPVEPQPGEILADRRGEFRPTSAAVDVLDAQEEAAAGAPRGLPADQRRMGVAEVQMASGAWRKARDDVTHAAATIASAAGA